MNLKRQIFELLLDHQNRWKCVPTPAQISAIFSDSDADVSLHLEQLEREGLIELSQRGEISVVSVPALIPAPRIRIRDGAPDVSASQKDSGFSGSITLDLQGVGVSMPKNSLEALRVSDDAMSDAGIVEGDIAIVAEAIPVRGDIVLVVLDDRQVLRRYIRIMEIPHVLAENPARPDLRAAFDLPIYGVLWGLIRMEPCRRSVQEIREAVSYSREETRHTPEEIDVDFPRLSSRHAAHSPLRPNRSKRARRPGKMANASQTRSAAHAVLLPEGWPEPLTGVRLNDNPTVEWPLT